ncbi:formate dehydrogenase subunit gamma [Azospirillum agricola]|uniref:formate dehydrogenase subunit gamma n=1 Tax=Azospirillum agricola TaxID=1720247 RepID=UPI000A0F3FC5|nr:formate dehydrogenase subunit gamma [Azospirillum agricola]SMH35333.1 formate dehydrogenase gamma subunit [Azospirillum lipoferum]
MRRILRLLLLAVLLTPVAFTQAGAQLYQTPGPSSPASKEQVPLYTPQTDELIGRVSIPDARSAVLIQPEGREWRAFRSHTLKLVVGGLALGMVVVLALFYLYRGKIRISAGWSGRQVLRFNGLDRFAHWTTAVSFLTMALTGVVLTFGRTLLIPLIGHPAFTSLAETSKSIHNFVSVPFIVGLLLIVALWARDNIPNRADWAWLKCMGGLMSKSGHHPDAGRFNAGQKGVFWTVVLGGAAMAVTGYWLMVPFTGVGIGGMQILHVIHGLLAALLIAAIIGHIYIGTVGMEGAFDAMGSGEVDENWAIEHHRSWYEEQRRKGYVEDRQPAE